MYFLISDNILGKAIKSIFYYQVINIIKPFYIFKKINVTTVPYFWSTIIN